MGARYGSLSLGDIGVKRMVEEFIVHGNHRYGRLSLGDVGVKRMVEEFIVHGHYRAQDHIHCNLMTHIFASQGQ